ncbi:MAG: hypothetical protein HC880_15310 [Bacteroidia bacterium]|nr:hypothetical protein [Bacteroidia bacterium]
MGDSEQVVVCAYEDKEVKEDGRIKFEKIASIDNPRIQEDVIHIMEGGKEAFVYRNEIYQIWKP